jgi:ATP-dependent RNA helicase DeaD
LSWNPTGLEALLDAHARRPHVVGDLPIGENARPLPAVGAARYVLTGPGGCDTAVSAALDALDPGSAFVWQRGVEPSGPVNVVLCADLPTREELSTLGTAGAPVLVLAPEQLPYAKSIASPLTPVPLPPGGTAAREARAAIAARLERGNLAAELALLAPLFERYDAAEVAAAVLAVSREAGSGKGEAGSVNAARVRIHVSVGKKDRAAAKDIVGALIREAGLSKDDIGRIDVRDTFSLVEVAGSAAERAVARLSGMMIRGRRVNARIDDR